METKTQKQPSVLSYAYRALKNVIKSQNSPSLMARQIIFSVRQDLESIVAILEDDQGELETEVFQASSGEWTARLMKGGIEIAAAAGNQTEAEAYDAANDLMASAL